MTSRNERQPRRKNAKTPVVAPEEIVEARATGPSRPRLDPPRRLALAASITIVGLGLVGVGESEVGAALVLVGLLFFAFAIHTYGRLGFERGDA
jgi:hypothetical protein